MGGSPYRLPLQAILRPLAEGQASARGSKEPPCGPSSSGLFPDTSRWHHPAATFVFQPANSRLGGKEVGRGGGSPHLVPVEPTSCRSAGGRWGPRASCLGSQDLLARFLPSSKRGKRGGVQPAPRRRRGPARGWRGWVGSPLISPSISAGGGGWYLSRRRSPWY